MSEDAALRRVHAARILRRFPVLYEQIAAGEIHLTAVLTLGPHLTEANHVEVLARAKYRTKKEVQALVRQLDPLPDVPACVEPLGPLVRDSAASPPAQPGGLPDQGQGSPLSNPSSGRWLASLCGPVRELPYGERPKDWNEAGTNGEFGVEVGTERGAGNILDQRNSSERGECDFADPTHECGARRGATPAGSLGSQRYKVQFTASQEYVELLEEARDLLAHAVPDRALDEVHLRALRLLVAELKKRKYALTDKARSLAPRQDKVSKSNADGQARVEHETEREAAPLAVSVRGEPEREKTAVVIPVSGEPQREKTAVVVPVSGEPQREKTAVVVPVRSEATRRAPALAISVRSEAKREPSEGSSELPSTTGERPSTAAEAGCEIRETRIASELVENPVRTDNRSARTGKPRWRGRHVSAAVRRAVAERDHERCAYVDDEGRRCRETSGLEFHHLEPHACGGPPTVANLSLRCRSHNGLAAENDFGRDFMAKKKTSHRANALSK